MPRWPASLLPSPDVLQQRARASFPSVHAPSLVTTPGQMYPLQILPLPLGACVGIRDRRLHVCKADGRSPQTLPTSSRQVHGSQLHPPLPGHKSGVSLDISLSYILCLFSKSCRLTFKISPSSDHFSQFCPVSLGQVSLFSCLEHGSRAKRPQSFSQAVPLPEMSLPQMPTWVTLTPFRPWSLR